MILKITMATALMLFWSNVRSWHDWQMLERGENINHKMNAILTFSVSMIVTLCTSFILIPYCLSIYWLVFDMRLNKLRGKDLLFVGTTAWLDKSFRKIAMLIQDFLFCCSYTFRGVKFVLSYFPISPGKVMLVAKVICLIVSIGVFVWFKK
jgi:hypothetical protein